MVLACAGLAVWLVMFNKKAERERLEAEANIRLLSDDVKKTMGALDEQKKVNDSLDSKLTERTAELLATSNRLEGIRGDLSQARTKAEADSLAAQEEIKKREAKISELEGRNEDLSRKMTDLNSSIDELEKQMTEIERKLSASEGDREFLLAELKRLQSEKADLERQFNDLALLRDQVRKLKDDLSIARRLEWIRRGLYGGEAKGAEKLEPGFATPPTQGTPDLDVEIRQDGGARVVAPTNAPAGAAPR